jgi:hypothetical protein
VPEQRRLNERVDDLEEHGARLRRLVWVLIVLVVLSGATGFGAARYYADGLRKQQRDACLDTRATRMIQNDSNRKTQAFLLITQRTRETAARAETGEKRQSDLRAARRVADLANSYKSLPVPDCR